MTENDRGACARRQSLNIGRDCDTEDEKREEEPDETQYLNKERDKEESHAVEKLADYR